MPPPSQGMGPATDAWSGAVAAARSYYQLHGNPNASIAECFNLIQMVCGSNLTPENAMRQIRTMHELSRSSLRPGGGGSPSAIGMIQSGVGLANQAGISTAFGNRTAMSSMAFGQAFRDRAGPQGFNGLSQNQAMGLDQQLRTAAAASPVANVLGAIAAMHADGVLPPNLTGEAAQIVQAAINPQARTPEVMQRLAQMQPQQIMNLLRQAGVGGATISQYVQARQSNQAFIAQHNIQDMVRGLQGQGEIASLMRNGLSSGMIGMLAESGMSNREAAQVSRRAAQAAQQAMMGMSAEMLNSTDPNVRAERNRIIGNAITGAVGHINGVDPNRLAAVAQQGLSASMSQNPGLAQFGNIGGLVTMNRGDVLSQGNANLGNAQAAANQAQGMAGVGGGPPLANLSDQLQGAGGNTNLGNVASGTLGMPPPQMGAALPSSPNGGAGGTSGPITINGTLTLNDDGTGDLNAASNAPGSAPVVGPN